jgi:plasmid stabilization system protein ParE
MKIEYLEEARRDLAWWRTYYRKTFPQGKGQAFRHLRVTERMLEEFPEIGSKILNTEWRKLAIPRTPFVIVYQIKKSRIEIVRVYDMRQGGSDSFQED